MFNVKSKALFISLLLLNINAAPAAQTSVKITVRVIQNKAPAKVHKMIENYEIEKKTKVYY